jgi:hypothetical protein
MCPDLESSEGPWAECSTGIHQALSKSVHEDDADDKIIDVEAAHPNQPRLEEARRRWMDHRTLYHPDDFY